MAFHASVPVRAELIETITGTLKVPSQFAGQTIEAKRYVIPAQYADGGTEHLWFKLSGEAKAHRYQYSGTKVPHCARQMNELRSHVEAR